MATYFYEGIKEYWNVSYYFRYRENIYSRIENMDLDLIVDVATNRILGQKQAWRSFLTR